MTTKLKLHVMDHTGHSTLEFDRTAPHLAEAEKKFKELLDAGKIASKPTGKQGEREVTRAFDPNVEEYLFSPHLKGG